MCARCAVAPQSERQCRATQGRRRRRCRPRRATVGFQNAISTVTAKHHQPTSQQDRGDRPEQHAPRALDLELKLDACRSSLRARVRRASRACDAATRTDLAPCAPGSDSATAATAQRRAIRCRQRTDTAAIVSTARGSGARSDRPGASSRDALLGRTSRGAARAAHADGLGSPLPAACPVAGSPAVAA